MTGLPGALPPAPPLGAMELARLLSVATRIEPELIRAVRLRLLPHLDVGAEADLWFCDWVGARTPEAIALLPECLPYLRAGLVDRLEREPRLRAVKAIITEFHEGLSPALLLEEQVTWDSLTGDTEGAAQHLNRALHALVRENRSGLAGWFAEASRRLPAEALSTATAWSLANASRPHVPSLDPGAAPELTLDTVSFIASAIGQARLGVLRAGSTLLLGNVRGEDAAAVVVPDTSPRVVEVTSGDTVRTVRVDAAEVVRVEVGRGTAEVRTGAGDVYVIEGPAAPDPAPAPAPAPEDTLADLVGAGVDPELVPRLAAEIRRLLDRARHTDEPDSLRQALALAERALDSGYEPRDFPDLGCEVAEALYLHGLRLSSRKSLDRAVHVAQQLADHPRAALGMRAGAVLGAAHRELFCRTGDLPRLYRSRDILETWVDRLTGGPGATARVTTELVHTCLVLHEVHPSPDLLGRALHLAESAYRSDDWETLALPLARVHIARYEATGNRADLDRAFQLSETTSQEPRSAQAERAAMVASALLALFWREGSTDHLESALQQSRSALGVSPGSDRLLRARLRHALSEVLRVRAAVLSEPADLDEAVAFANRAAKTLPRDSIWRMAALITLNQCHLDTFRRTGDVSTLDLAVEATREVVSRSKNHPDLPYRHLALLRQGECLVLRFRATGDDRTLGHAIDSLRASREDSRDLSPAQQRSRTAAYATILLDLQTTDSRKRDVGGLLLELNSLLRYDVEGPPTDPESATILLAEASVASGPQRSSYAVYRQAADKARLVAVSRHAPPLQRLRAGLLWGELALRQNRAEDVVLSHETVAGLIPLVLLASGREHPDLVRAWEELSREAAACAMEVGAPERALEFLEQRNVLLTVWQQDSRAEVDRLRDAAPELVAELRRLWAFLHLAPKPAVSRPHPEQQELAPARLDHLIAAMLAVPGFKDLLAPVPARRLVAAASEGPVVVLNAAARHCDALLVTRNGVSALRLPGVSMSGLSGWAEMYQSAMGEDRQPWDEQAAWSVLGLLGDHVVEPVLTALGMPRIAGSGAPATVLSDALPRMWWCPTAPFTTLPLQLAGQPQDNALNYAVHSYTSSLQALTSARSRARHTALDSAQAMLLVLADGDLPYGRKEIDETRTRVPLTHVLQGVEATDANVAELIADFPFFHFVGRVRLDEGVPRLRLFTQDTAGEQLPAVGDGALAYLSVRNTRKGGVSLESVGWALATRFQAAGFDHVIGMLVPGTGGISKNLAHTVYDRLLTPDGRLQPERSAHALHDTLREAITHNPGHALALASVIHFGP
ncbi:CHAT domain-containing protein [Streptomyces sp. SP17KL33]|uniref:CHAT domain-containing protein n=1 Tax=Streptomyces sp. SP17KL33 TaxID=3002534 RepID=UPI002E793D15|nr:CHAT domain-containing protein [Streptomyces sp. SP17KL33]MEE1832488.1 CHAT domain-containing protein [Streptomyces sp. SP17KL33]